VQSNCNGATLETTRCVSELAFESARALDQLLLELDYYFPNGAWEQAFSRNLMPQRDWETAKQAYCTFETQNWISLESL
jgi:hypothetical protein